MVWDHVDKSVVLGTTWQDRPDLYLDPYLLWADLTAFSGTTRAQDVPERTTRFLRVALELDSDAVLDFPHQVVARNGKECYATASAAPNELAALTRLPGVKRIELGFAGGTKPSFEAANRKVNPEDKLSRPVVAVIDFGCAFAHERFRHWNQEQQCWNTRIAYLWDQGEGRGTGPWREAAGQGYGRELAGADIDALLAVHSQRSQPDEDSIYSAAAYDSVSKVLTHGTHVLDLAAGAPADANQALQPSIIFVQLPQYAVDDTSGGSMVTHVLDALRYILERTHETAPLVINLSYGSMAGPHDGSTVVECAMDAVVATAMKPLNDSGVPSRYLAIVLAAGNSFEADGHAAIKLTSGAPRCTLPWQVLADDLTDTFLEIWYPKHFGGYLEITVTSPTGASCTVPIDSVNVLLGATGKMPVAAVIHRLNVASGLNDAMALVALAPTRVPQGERPEAMPGIWELTIALTKPLAAEQAIELNAWIERDDPVVGSGAPSRQSRLLTGNLPLQVNEDDPPGSLVRRAGTCSSIANGTRTVVVGACLSTAEGLELSRYSSAGPTRNPLRAYWPDLVATSDESRTLAGVVASGTRSGTLVRMNGTSVAAPQVARRLIAQFLPYFEPAASRGGKPVRPTAPRHSILDQTASPPAGVSAHRVGRGRLLP